MLEIEKQKIQAEIDYKKARTSEVQNKLKNIKDNSLKIGNIDTIVHKLYQKLNVDSVTAFSENIQILKLIDLLETQKSNLIR
jgi:hypothetical protein